jgi:hypothetical protein
MSRFTYAWFGSRGRRKTMTSPCAGMRWRSRVGDEMPMSNGSE